MQVQQGAIRVAAERAAAQVYELVREAAEAAAREAVRVAIRDMSHAPLPVVTGLALCLGIVFCVFLATAHRSRVLVLD